MSVELNTTLNRPHTIATTHKSDSCCYRCLIEILQEIWRCLARLFCCAKSSKQMNTIAQKKVLYPFDQPLIQKTFTEQMNKVCSTGHPRDLKIAQGDEKARKNMMKAILEHFAKNASYISWADFVANQPAVRDIPYTFSFSEHSEQGKRLTNEDSHFIADHPDWILTGLFDGHSGSPVAQYAQEHFDARFTTALEKAPGNIFYAFEFSIYTLQQEIAEQGLGSFGSTGVVCYIDKKSGHIYTATLGDSEALLFRKESVIPLSCVRDFRSQYDSIRLATLFVDTEEFQKGTPEYSKKLEQLATDFRKKKGKPRTFVFYPKGRFHSLNVSRALGDIKFVEEAGILPKCKITATQIASGDILVIACDGFMDYVLDPKEMRELVAKNKGSPNLAKELVTYALQTKKSGDNVTAITIKIC